MAEHHEKDAAAISAGIPGATPAAMPQQMGALANANFLQMQQRQMQMQNSYLPTEPLDMRDQTVFS